MKAAHRQNTICSLFFLLSFTTFIRNAHAQGNTQAKESISNTIAGYFDLDRETIHAHFDKTTFFSNEQIWFKGYVFNKKMNTPFFETTNVFAVLLDDKGVELREQLLFSYNGTFVGSFKLGSAIKSGRYHIRFYTNWMNNFIQDESSSFAVHVINREEGVVVDYDTANVSHVNIGFQPEGGAFVAGVVNNLAIKIADCNGNPIGVTDGKIVAANGETIRNFIVSKMGYAKIYLTPTNETYKAVFVIDNKNVEAILPKTTNQGIALEANNYALPGKTIIKVRATASTLASIPGKLVYAVVQQNEKSNIFDIQFTDLTLEKELVITNNNLFPGMNTIRIIDGNKNEWAQRMLFETPQNKTALSLSLESKVNDTLHFSGATAFPNANLSIAILPENTLSDNKSNDLYSSFWIDSYLKESLGNAAYYLNDATKAKRYELDLFLLSQKAGKYDWRDIQSTPPKMTYDFDIGLAIKGTINQSLADKKNHRIQLLSVPLLLNDYSAIDDNNGFNFKNLVIADSSMVKFTLMKMPSVPVDMLFYQQVLNRKRSLNKPFDTSGFQCPGNIEKLDVNDMPQFGNDVIALSNIDITGKPKKAQLKHQKDFGNASLRGIKIGPENGVGSLISFIEANGFEATNNRGVVTILSRQRMSLSAQRMGPEVYISGRQLLSLDELADIRMDEVDEIYLDPHAIVASIKGNMGIIKIYLKRFLPGEGGFQKAKTKAALIKEGFAKTDDFQNPYYISTSDQGFQNYGAVHWIPYVLTDQLGGFRFTVPNPHLKSIRIKIEGFTPDGKMVSETRTINL